MCFISKPEYMRGGLYGADRITAMKQVCAMGPAKLARTLRKAPSTDVRCAAVRRLRDMELLARTARGDLDQFVRIAAIKRLDELSRENAAAAGEDNVSRANSALFERVCEILGVFGSVLRTAGRIVRKIRKSDNERYGIPVQMLFSGIARGDPDGNVRRTAAERLNDMHLLAVIAESDPEEYVREAARKRLNQ